MSEKKTDETADEQSTEAAAQELLTKDLGASAQEKSDESAVDQVQEDTKESADDQVQESAQPGADPVVVDESESESEQDPDDKGGLEQVKGQLSTQKKENKRLQGVIKGVLDIMTSSLSDPDKELLQSLAGPDPDKQLEIFNRLKGAGKFSATTTVNKATGADQTRVATNQENNVKPDSWKEADKRVARKLKSV